MTGENGHILYISHGGGPLPLLGHKGHLEMVENLKHLTTLIQKPEAIIVISAHWEEKIPTVTSGSNPELIYDYYGFPRESYEIEYPCPGEPAMAEKISQAVANEGFEVDTTPRRGFDHGVFVPLKIMYPRADIPCVQLSLIKGLDPLSHIRLGRALADVVTGNILVIGSGFSFHNMRAFFEPESQDSKAKNEAFETWLIETLSGRFDENERVDRLVNWQVAPFSRYCHPREEHLMPLHVCYGVAGSPCNRYFELQILNKKSSVYIW